MALRIWVSIFAIGSVTVTFTPLDHTYSGIISIQDIVYQPHLFKLLLINSPGYQLDFLTPGIWPARASLRKQIRHKPKVRI
jgi:hypothetical protein